MILMCHLTDHHCGHFILYMVPIGDVVGYSLCLLSSKVVVTRKYPKEVMKKGPYPMT